MNRKLIWGSLATLLMMLALLGVCFGQEPPAQPEAPGMPHPPKIMSWTSEGAFLGVTLSELTPAKARDLKLPGDRGALVVNVEKDTPAARADIEKNDVIVEFDGEAVRSAAQLRRMVRETPVDRTVAIKVIRNGQPHTLSAKLQENKHEFSFAMPGMNLPRVKIPEFNLLFVPGRPVLGITGDDLTKQLAEYFGVKQANGVLVSEVMLGSAAEKAGLKAGDVITALNDKPVGSVEELHRALESVTPEEGKRKVTLTIVRNHAQMTLPVELEPVGPDEPGHMAEVFGVNPAELEEMKAEIKSHAEEARRAAEDFRQEWEKNRPEVERLKAEAQAEAAEAQRQAVQLQKELQEQQKLLQGKWQRELEQEVKQLKEELKNNPQLRHLTGADHVI